MTFTSITWIAAIVFVVGVYWLLPARVRDEFLMAASLGLLAYVDVLSAAILVGFVLVVFLVGRMPAYKSAALAVAVVLFVGTLGVFKSQVASGPVDVVRDVAIPLGMSYYTFRAIHYVIDLHRGALPAHSFRDFAKYMLFLPTIPVGPINRFPAFKADCDAHGWQSVRLSAGIERLLIGYFKIVVIGSYLFANYLAVQIGSLGPEYLSLQLYLEAVRGSLLLYFMFSGYSDVAIGFGLLLGYKVMENFDNPFMKPNIAQFWRAWHISLTSWSRDYIYMTVLGLSRNPYLGTMASLLVIGIWHELSLRYVVWGLYHGAGIIFVNKLDKVKRAWRKQRGRKPVRTEPDALPVRGFKIFLTANYFFFGYVIISQESLSDTLQVYNSIFFGWLG